MIGLRTQRSSAPTEGLEDVTAFSGPSKTVSAREMEADKGDVSGTEERRNVEAREDEGVCTAPQGLQCAEKRKELESEELLKLDSRNKGSISNSGEGDRAHTDSLTVLDEDSGDETASSDLSKPIPEKVNVSTEHGKSNVVRKGAGDPLKEIALTNPSNTNNFTLSCALADWVQETR